MRKILISTPGEFSVNTKADFARGVAVRLLASLIDKYGSCSGEEKGVVVSRELDVKKIDLMEQEESK